MDQVEVVAAHDERATLRVGDVFLKIDADQPRTDVELKAMAMAPIPTAEVLWRKPPVVALAELAGLAALSTGGRRDGRSVKQGRRVVRLVWSHYGSAAGLARAAYGWP